MPKQKVELNLLFEEYRSVTSHLAGVAYQRLKRANLEQSNRQEHLELADTLAKARHQIASQIGIDRESLDPDPVSEAVLKAWEAHNAPAPQCCPCCGRSIADKT